MFNILIIFNKFLQKSYLLLMLLFVIWALIQPEIFMWLIQHISMMLGIIMFGMGVTIRLSDFKMIIYYPKALFIGIVAQFVLMPALAYFLVKLFHLPVEIAIGVILVGCCPGGTASNVITYLARGNLALSISCTSVSTLLAPILTPAIFYFLAHQWLVIDVMSIFISVIKMVFLPIVLGIIFRSLFSQQQKIYENLMPPISIIAIILIVSAIVAANKTAILQSGLLICSMVIIHNLLGCFCGYYAGRLFRLSKINCRTLSIEVGMQNSGLGVALAAIHFNANPIAAVPSAIFSVWHNISGSILAYFWAKKADKTET